MSDSQPFGKALAGQLKRLMDQQAAIQPMQDKFIADGDAAEVVSKLRDSAHLLSWGWHYELPFAMHAGLLLAGLTSNETLLRLSISETQIADLLYLSSDENAPAVEQTIESMSREQAIFILALASSAALTLKSISIYSASINQLVERVRKNNDDEALFHAVSIDLCVQSAPTIAARICQAQFMGDKQFFRRLRKAYKGPNKGRIQYSRLRIAELMLHECNAKSTASTHDINQLVTEKLQVFDGRSGSKNLLALFRNFRKEATD